MRAAIIHLGGALLRRSSDLPGSVPRCARIPNSPISNLEFEIRAQREAGRISPDSASLFGLAPQGVCLAGHVATSAGDAFTSPFHHRPSRCCAASNFEFRTCDLRLRNSALRAVYSLLHFSVGSPRLAVSQPAHPVVFGLSSRHAAARIPSFQINLKIWNSPRSVPYDHPVCSATSYGSIARQEGTTRQADRPGRSDMAVDGKKEGRKEMEEKRGRRKNIRRDSPHNESRHQRSELSPVDHPLRDRIRLRSNDPKRLHTQPFLPTHQQPDP